MCDLFVLSLGSRASSHNLGIRREVVYLSIRIDSRTSCPRSMVFPINFMLEAERLTTQPRRLRTIIAAESRLEYQPSSLKHCLQYHILDWD